MNHEEKCRQAKLLSDAILQSMEVLGSLFGADLAMITQLGSLISSGSQSKIDTGRSWYLVLATNEAAEELRKWSIENTAGRVEAMKKRGDGTAITESSSEWKGR